MKYPLELVEKEVLTHDTRRFRFALPTKEHSLGIQLGHHVMLTAKINGDIVVRPYTPTSSVDEKGHFDLVMKVYKASQNPDFPNGGKMSQYMDSLKIGDKIDVRGPTGRMNYKRNGIFHLKFDRTSPLTTLNVKNLGMIAGGTGITPMFQLIKDICEHPEDQTKMSLIFSNKTADDILLKGDLETYQENHSDKLKVWYTLSSISFLPDWKYDFGRVNEEMLQKHLPPPGEGTLILICGPSPMIKSTCVPCLEKLGYTKQMIYIC